MTLTQEQITIGNDKIAKFLKWFKHNGHKDSWFVQSNTCTYVAYSIHNNYPHNDLPFHRDWNYLMSVIDEIGTIVYYSNDDAPDYDWKKHYSYSELFHNLFQKWLRFRFEEHNEEFNLMNDLTSVWCAVVAYIDWYNEDNKL